MKGTSRVIMGATLVMVVSLAVVLGLILVLLAELYCSLLLRRRHLRKNNTTIPTAAATPQTTTTTPSYSPSQHAPHSPPPPPPPPPPFNNNNIYSQGVLQAPRTFLFPSIACMEDPNANPNANASPRRIGLVSVPSPLASFISRAPPPMQCHHHQEDPLQNIASSIETISCPDPNNNKPSVEEKHHHHLVYISNPIYENEEGIKASGENRAVIINTPFETPDTSPSRLDGSGDGSSDNDDHVVVCVPLTPMKKLPSEGCSVSLRDATRSSLLGTLASDSRSNNGVSSSSSSVSHRTSPSW